MKTPQTLINSSIARDINNFNKVKKAGAPSYFSEFITY